MEPGKAVDCYRCEAGHDIQQAAAEQAYVQADLEGTRTWVSLPIEAWLTGWLAGPNKGDRQPRYTKPVARLKKALHGHPDSGTFWEKHCNRAVAEAGFFHEELDCSWLSTWTMWGPRGNVAPGWSLLRHSLHLEDAAPAHLYLGCIHQAREVTAENKVTARAVAHNMEDYLRNTVAKYCDLARKITGQALALQEWPPLASTPFLHEDHIDAPAAMAKG